MKQLIFFGLLSLAVVYGTLWAHDIVKCEYVQEVLFCNEKLCRVRLSSGRAYVEAPVVGEDKVCRRRISSRWKVCDECNELIKTKSVNLPTR